MPVSVNFSTIYSESFIINHTQCRFDSTLKYIDLCTMFQLVCANHSVLGGVGIKEMNEINQAWILNKMRIEIKELPSLEDEVLITSWVEEIGGKKSIRKMEMFKNGISIAEASTLWVVVNTKERKIEDLKLPYQHYDLSLFKEKKKEIFQKIKFPDNLTLKTSRKVVVSDLDTVNHVNNLKYLEWCFDLFSPTSIQNKNISKIEINYKKEMRWNDTADIYIGYLDKTGFFKIKNQEETCFSMSATI